MHETDMRVATPEGEMAVFMARPDGPGPFPVAMVYMDAFGYREALKGNVRRFTAAGYCCLMPDLFHRTGDRRTLDPAEMGDEDFTARLRALVAGLTPDMVAADTRAALEAVADDPAVASEDVVCVGYCVGARMALHVASALNDRVRAAAAIHPGALATDAPGSPHHDLDGVAGELLVAFAERDRSATAEAVRRFEDEVATRAVRATVIRVPGAQHGFAMPDLPVHDAAAAEDHFARTLLLWGRSVPPGPAETGA